MKSTLTAAISACLMLVVSLPLVANDRVSDEIGAVQKMIEENGYTWEAGYNEILEIPLEQRRQRLGFYLPDDAKKMFEALDKLPPPLLTDTQDYFDWRLLGGVTPVKDQGNCGSCWAFGATGAFESCYLIATDTMPDFSEQALVSCDQNSDGCNGGYTGSAFDYFSIYGAIDETCFPYQANDDVPCRQDSCEAIGYLQGYTPIPNNVASIKNAVVMGPVVTSYTVYDDFYSYHGGCYEHQGDTEPTNHAVVIVGWDDNECNGQGAWIVKNSWGAGWGGPNCNGYFRIKYGTASIGTSTMLPAYQYAGMPQLEYSPDSIQVDLHSGEQQVRTLELSNVGDGDLRYYISGQTVTELDSFGYYYRDSDDSDGPDYNWIDVTSVGQLVDFYGYNNDGNSGQLNFGFNFNFYGNTYHELNICTNGWISFNNAFLLEWNNMPIPDRRIPNNLLAVFFDDLNLEYGGHVYFYTNNTDTAIVTWDQVPDSRQEGTFTFQAIITAPNDIVFQYNSMGPGRLNECSIGIENLRGSVGTQVVCDNDYIHNQLAVKFLIGDAPPPLDWVITDPSEGTIPGYSQQDIQLTFNALNLPPGIYRAIFTIMTNAMESPVVYLPVTMNLLTTGIDDETPPNAVPQDFALNAAFPNPFNPAATVSYSLPHQADITLEVFNLVGQKVTTLFEGRREPGTYSAEWRAESEASGTYVVVLSDGSQTRSVKVILLK